MTGSKRIKRVVTAISAAVILAVVLLGLFQVYETIDVRDHSEIDTKEEYVGDIETTPKKWLNGHLGIFFRFKHLGNINWLLPFLLIIYVINIRKRGQKLEQWQKALLFVWLVTAVFLGIKGYGNARYQLTLFPITVTMVLLLMWQMLKDKKRYIKIIAFTLVAVSAIYNISHYSYYYKRTWDTRVQLKTPTFPYKMINYINGNRQINNDSRVFAINQPIFFYHTRKVGVDYLSPNAVGAWRELRKIVGSSEKAFRRLKKKLRVKYVLIKSIHKRFYRSIQLEEFLETQCTLAMEDNGWELYRLRDKSLLKLIESPRYKTVNVWNPAVKYKKSKKTDGSKPGDKKERKKAAGKVTVKDISPQMFRFYRQGIYKFEIQKRKRTHFVTVRNTRIKPGHKPRLQFGYEFGKNGLDEKIPEGKVVTFIVKASISRQLLNIHNAIFVMDYKENKKDKKNTSKDAVKGSWEQTKTVFTTPRWRTYMVSKRVRRGVSRLVLMIRFSPETPRHRLRIGDVRVVVSDEPLK